MSSDKNPRHESRKKDKANEETERPKVERPSFREVAIRSAQRNADALRELAKH